VKQAAEENAEIWWLDEVGARNASNYIKGYAPRGETPTVPVASAHIGTNMISAITNAGKLRYHFYRGKLSAGIYTGFLMRIINTTDKKVFAIVDNSSTHRSNAVTQWKEKQAEYITIFDLPTYAPHLNPVEYLNNNLKRVLLKKGYSVNENEIESKARSVMRSIQSTNKRVESFFDNEHVKYAKFME